MRDLRAEQKPETARSHIRIVSGAPGMWRGVSIQSPISRWLLDQIGSPISGGTLIAESNGLTGALSKLSLPRMLAGSATTSGQSSCFRLKTKLTKSPSPLVRQVKERIAEIRAKERQGAHLRSLVAPRLSRKSHSTTALCSHLSRLMPLLETLHRMGSDPHRLHRSLATACYGLGRRHASW